MNFLPLDRNRAIVQMDFEAIVFIENPNFEPPKATDEEFSPEV